MMKWKYLQKHCYYCIILDENRKLLPFNISTKKIPISSIKTEPFIIHYVWYRIEKYVKACQVLFKRITIYYP